MTQFSNIFVLCTGRCGSSTFIAAASHIENYTAAHESRSHLPGPARLAYPAHHIEADNRLSWLLGRLDRAYGKDAFYVHLLRCPDAVARSFEKRADRGIVDAYKKQILMGSARKSKEVTSLDFCRDYVDTVTANIDLFLRDKPHQMRFRLETAVDDMKAFWLRTGAKGDLDAGLAEWAVRHNASS